MTDGKTSLHSNNLNELNKARLDLAWKHFELAISQRLMMFNYYMVLMGGLIYALATTLKSDQTGIVHVWIGGLGIAAGIFFGLLDQRNQYLYRMAEYNIYLLERTFLYDQSQEHPLPLSNPNKGRDKPRSCYKGIVTTQWEGDSNLRRIEEYASTCHLFKIVTYGILMPFFYLFTVAIFVVVVYIWW
jgi:hypothetical protein